MTTPGLGAEQIDGNKPRRCSCTRQGSTILGQDMTTTRTVEVSHISKSFRDIKAVNDVSFVVDSGEILGMVGPNGAGKTTTIRMLMDIIKPDSGEILILGQPLREDTKDRIGYLPEERGLYRKISVTESLSYLATLKNMNRDTAGQRAEQLLKRLNMWQHRDKKIEELSRGMGQLIRFVATIVHDPELIVLDEPFSGLDPVNTEVLKEFITELKGQGKSLILSTHIMNQVEELCDNVLMINKGAAVLNGRLGDVKAKYRSNSVILECDRVPEDLPGVSRKTNHGAHTELFLNGRATPQEVLAALVARGVIVTRFEVATPSLNEIFIQVVREGS